MSQIGALLTHGLTDSPAYLLTYGLGSFTGTVANSLVESIQAFLAADPGVSTLLDGEEWYAAAPRSSDAPYVTWEEVETNQQNYITGKQLTWATVHFYARAANAATAKATADSLKAILLPSSGASPFSGTYGTEAGRYTTGPDSLALDPLLSANGTDIWAATFPVTFMIAKG